MKMTGLHRVYYGELYELYRIFRYTTGDYNILWTKLQQAGYCQEQTMFNNVSRQTSESTDTICWERLN